MYHYNSIDTDVLYKKYLAVSLPSGDRYGLNQEVVLSRDEFICRVASMESPERIALIDALEGNDEAAPGSVDAWIGAFEVAEEMLLDAPNSSPKKRLD